MAEMNKFIKHTIDEESEQKKKEVNLQERAKYCVFDMGQGSVNSKAYWEKRFKEDWDAADGPRQSRFFARLAIENLPSWLIKQIRCQALTLADWGCAQGDGTDVWASYVDSRQLVGVDFSRVAINQASSRYPAIRFVAENWIGVKPTGVEVYDVVFSSNTLEHFHRPYEVLEDLSLRARKAVALVLPYRELERIDEHFFSFLPSNIPLVLNNGFRLVWSRVIDCGHLPNTPWDGDQILLLYTATAWTDSLNLTLRDSVVEQEDTALKINNLNQGIAERDGQINSLNQTVVARDERITGLSQAVAERDAQMLSLNQGIAEREGRIASLADSVREKDQQLIALAASVTEQEGRIGNLEEIVREKDSQIISLSQTAAERDAQIISLNQTVAERDGQIAAIISSTSWRLTRSMRWLGYQIKRSRYLLRITPQIIARKGGIWRTGAAVLRVYRREGFTGVNCRIKQLQTGPHPNFPGIVERDKSAQKLTLSNQEHYLMEKTAQNGYLANYLATGLESAHFDLIHEKIASKAVKRDKVVIYPLSYPMELTQRPDHILRNFAENGYQCIIISIDSNPPFIKEVSHNIYLTNLFAGVISYFSNKKIVFYITYPFYSYILNHLQRSIVVYDVLDDLSVFSLDCEAMRTDHMGLLRRADVTLFSSQELFNINGNDVKGRAYLVNNGVWTKDFVLESGHARKNINFRKHPDEYVLGYHGAITELLDWGLLLKLIEIPNVRIILIGPLTHFDGLVSDSIRAIQQRVLASKQVTHIQPVPYLELKYYLNGFDVAIIPFVVNKKTNPVLPLKLFEYMAMGLKVFATPTKTLSRYSKFISVIDSNTMPKRVREMMGNFNNALKIDYSAILSDADWNKQLAPVISLLEEKITNFKNSVKSAKTVDIININFYDWDGVTLYQGGAERYVYDLARMLKEDGWSPRILQNANTPFKIDFRGIPVIGIQTDNGHNTRGMSKKYREACCDSDLVIASPIDLACELWGLNVIGINHGIHWDHKYKKLETTTLEEHRNIFDALKTSSAVVAVDTNFINWVRTYDYDLGRKLTYIPNYFDSKVFTPISKSFGGNLRILYPRRLYEARGIFVTLKAFDYLLNRHEGIELHLVGQAGHEERQVVSRFIKKHKNRVIWEEVDMDDMYKVYQTSHIVLIPTMFSEGTSLSCLEAMATNNVVIATNVGGLPNLVIDGFNGFLINPTVETLIKSIETLLADRILMQKLALNGINLATAFEKNRWIERWRRIIAETSM